MTSMKPAVVQDVARLLVDLSCEEVRAYAVSGVYDYVDFCIIATARSSTHRRGIMERLSDFFYEHGLEHYGKLCAVKGKSNAHEQGWLLLDLQDAVVHLMDEDIRAFYELEKLWFDADCIFDAAVSPEVSAKISSKPGASSK